MRDNSERLKDILEAIANIEQYSGVTRDAFESDMLIQTWFLRQLQIIGEATRALPTEIRNLASDIPWNKIVGMRNILVHGYFDIDTALVWDAVKNDLPELKPKIKVLLDKLK